MLKRKVSKEVYDAMSDAEKALYAVNPSRAEEYLLDVEPDADNGALKRAKDTEKRRADDAEAKLAEVTAELDTANATIAAGRPEVAALELKYKDKETKLKADHAKELAAKDEQLTKVLVKNRALELASSISSTPELIAPLIEKRLKANFSDPENPGTDVLDAAGLATSLTLEDLAKEFVANPKYAAIMLASNASGGGALPTTGGGGALPNGKKFDDLTEAQRIEWAKRDPKAFTAASDANRNAKSAAL